MLKNKKGISLIVLVLIVAVIVVGAIAIILVMNKGKDDTSNYNSQVATNKNENTTVQTDEYEGIAYVGSRNIAINYKTGRRKDTKSSSIVFHNEKTYLSVLAYDKEKTFNGTLDNVFNLLNDGRIFRNISSYTGSCFSNNDKTYLINKTSEQKVKISEVDAIKFNGNVLDEKGNNCYIYGYNFIMDNTPCMLVGCVFSEEQENSSISSMCEEIDAMMQTVRTTE